MLEGDSWKGAKMDKAKLDKMSGKFMAHRTADYVEHQFSLDNMDDSG
jgi:hypothetical protein